MPNIQQNLLGPPQKSIGEITFRHIETQGMTSQYTVNGICNTPKQAGHRNSFSEMARLSTVLNPVIELGFDRTKHRTKRNHFVKRNSDLYNFMSDIPDGLKDHSPLFNLFLSMRNPLFSGQVTVAYGSLNAKSLFQKDDDGHLYGILTLSREFRQGDTIHIVACPIFIEKGMCRGFVRLYSVNPDFIGQDILVIPNYFIINEKTIPEIDNYCKLPQSAQYIGTIATAFVTNNDERSTATFALAEEFSSLE